MGSSSTRVGRPLFTRASSRWICSSCRRSQALSVRQFSSTTLNFDEAPGNDLDVKPSKGERPRHNRDNNLGRTKVVSLIQPTGIPHLGNYLGALRQWKRFQDEKTDPNPRRRRNHLLVFGIADLHALTSTQAPEVRRENIRQTYASLLAIGLDPRQSILFVQSHMAQHSELMWILSNVASTGYLSRMTQWKDKIGVSQNESMENLDEKERQKLKLSLFSYPVLQAADILLYGPDRVPVGEDQSQHIEFTRHVARSFNSAYAKDGQSPILKIPMPFLSPAKRIMSLQNPEKKMSKSDPDPDSRILITDSAEDIKAKIKRAKTDSVAGPLRYDPENRPGVSNLIDILKHTTKAVQPQEDLAAKHSDLTLGALKALVAEEVIKELAGIRERYDSLMTPGNDTIDSAMNYGCKMARTHAGQTLKRVKDAVGLYAASSVSALSPHILPPKSSNPQVE